MKKDEWILSKELGRLRKYGYKLKAKRVKKNEIYDIVFENSGKILEPYCSIEEILGIVNSMEICLNMIIEYNKGKKYG